MQLTAFFYWDFCFVFQYFFWDWRMEKNDSKLVISKNKQSQTILWKPFLSIIIGGLGFTFSTQFLIASLPFITRQYLPDVIRWCSVGYTFYRSPMMKLDIILVSWLLLIMLAISQEASLLAGWRISMEEGKHSFSLWSVWFSEFVHSRFSFVLLHIWFVSILCSLVDYSSYLGFYRWLPWNQ